MNIIACVKQTPDTAAKLQVTDKHVTWGDSPLVVNPWDEFAVEESLLLKDKTGSKAIALSMGPESAKEALRTCLAVGVDGAFLVSDPALKGSDVTATAYTLAKAIQKIGDCELALLGRQAIDGDTGLTPAILARQLGWTLLTGVIKIVDLNLQAKTIKVERVMDEARQIVTAKLPVVVSVVKGINEPRYASFMGIRKAAKIEIPVWNAAALGLEAGKIGAGAAAVSWPEIYPMPAKETAVEIITGATPAEIAANLADKLVAEKVL